RERAALAPRRAGRRRRADRRPLRARGAVARRHALPHVERRRRRLQHGRGHLGLARADRARPPEVDAMGDLVEYRVEDGLAWLVLTNPPANAYSYEMMRALDEAILKARFDDTVHALVIRGSGDKFFCAG